VITVNLKKGVFIPEYFKNTVFGLNTSREILAFTVLSIVDNGESWEGARSGNTVLECLWRMNKNGA
jgi:hypothetical protein